MHRQVGMVSHVHALSMVLVGSMPCLWFRILLSMTCSRKHKKTESQSDTGSCYSSENLFWRRTIWGRALELCSTPTKPHSNGAQKLLATWPFHAAAQSQPRARPAPVHHHVHPLLRNFRFYYLRLGPTFVLRHHPEDITGFLNGILHFCWFEDSYFFKFRKKV